MTGTAGDARGVGGRISFVLISPRSGAVSTSGRHTACVSMLPTKSGRRGKDATRTPLRTSPGEAAMIGRWGPVASMPSALAS